LVEVKVNGLQELRAAMLKLPKEMDRKTLNAALFQGGKLMVNDARGNVPVLQTPTPHRNTGTVRKNIRARTGRPIAGMTATVIVGVRKMSRGQINAFKSVAAARGKKVAGSVNPDDPFYWRFLEFGYTDRGGTWHPGKSFLRNAFETTKGAAIGEITRALAFQIRRRAAQLGLKIR